METQKYIYQYTSIVLTYSGTWSGEFSNHVGRSNVQKKAKELFSPDGFEPGICFYYAKFYRKTKNKSNLIYNNSS